MTMIGWLKQTFGGFAPAAAATTASSAGAGLIGSAAQNATGITPLTFSEKSTMAKQSLEKKWAEREARQVVEKHNLKTRTVHQRNIVTMTDDVRGDIDADGFARWVEKQQTTDAVRRRLEEEMARQLELERIERMIREAEMREQRMRQEPDAETYQVGERYTDAEGRVFRRTLENKIKPVVHKAGHFPVEWMIEGAKRAEESDYLVRIEAGQKGVAVVGEQGEDYAQHEIPWQMMEKSEINPLILAIENVERQLRVVSSLQQTDKKREGMGG